MKRVIIMLLTAALCIQATAQNPVVSLYKKYENNPDVSSVYISKAMVDMMRSIADETETEVISGKNNRIEIEGVNIYPVISKLNEIYIISTENPEIGKRIKSEMGNTDDYTELMRIKDGGDDVRFLYKNSPDGKSISEILMSVLSGSETVIIAISTDRLDTKDLSDVAKVMMQNM